MYISDYIGNFHGF